MREAVNFEILTHLSEVHTRTRKGKYDCTSSGSFRCTVSRRERPNQFLLSWDLPRRGEAARARAGAPCVRSVELIVRRRVTY